MSVSECGGAWPIGDFPRPGVPVGYVPEPSAIALACLGALAVLLIKSVKASLARSNGN